MFKSVKKVFSKTIAGLLVGAAFVIAPLAVQAATTNTFNFNNTTLGVNVGPNNPANGPVAFYGTNLAAGDVLVFDGIVIDNSPSAGGDWGAVDFNGSGTGGVTGATLGVLLRDGTVASVLCAVWTSGTSVNVGVNPTPATNRCRVELTCTQTGSTTNMSYVVYIDQGVTGTFNIIYPGSGLNFPNNVVPLTFGTRNEPHTFIQNQPLYAVSAPTPGTNTVAAGSTATFNAGLTAGWPLGNAYVQWLSNGVPIVGANGLTYTTPPVTASYSNAQYSVIVSNTLNSANVVTSSVAVIYYRSSGPGFIAFNFPDTTTTAGLGSITDPGVSISGSLLLVGDKVVFDGILTPNGAQGSDAWTSINIDGSGYGNYTTAKLGVLCRQGAGPSQLVINGIGSSNPTPGGCPTNRVRIELYPSINGSTTNMGWLVEIDQNLTGTFLPAITGTNLTFPNNTLTLTFGSSGASSFVYQNPQSPVSIFTQPNPLQVVAVGAPISVGVTVMGWSPAFQWRKNGAVILNATNESYTQAAATILDSGDQFTVVISNRLNSLNVVTSAVAHVSVLIPNNLSWYPTADFTNWDTVTPNWTTNGGVGQITFSSGNNVTFDALGYNIGGNSVTVTNAVNPNALTVNAAAYETYQLGGAGSVSGQSLHLTGDGTGTLGLQASASFASATIDAGSTLDIGYAGTDDSAFGANYITNNGTIDFQNASTLLTISGVITGSGVVIQDGAGTTILSAPNSAYTIGSINSGILLIASTPNPGEIPNSSELQPNSPASVLVIPNVVSGSGHYAFTGFQTTILTGVSTFYGANRIAWGPVIVDNPQALGDTGFGYTAVMGADNLGGLYLSNNITWSQALELDPRLNVGVEATAPQIANRSGTNIITSPLNFATGQGGSEINVEATAGQLTIDATSTLANNAGNNANNLNLQGSATGIWNGVLSDGSTVLNVLKRGAGTWTLGGANTYSGTTTISNGTLVVSGSLSTGPVSVMSGGILAGNGVINGPVTDYGGNGVYPVDFTGSSRANTTLTINNTFTMQGTVTMCISKTGGTRKSDLITGVTTANYGGTLVITNVTSDATTLTTNDTFTLFSATTHNGHFANIVGSPGSGLKYTFTNGVLSVAVGAKPVPRITNISLSGTTLAIYGTNGASNGQYVLLGSTNVAKPLNQWTPLLTNHFDVNGIINLSTNIVNLALPREFYILLQ
jgi:autotransporter-associated beta strand protein